VVTDAGQGFYGVTPDRFQTHALTGSVQVRLEGHDLGVLFQYRIGMQFLGVLVTGDADIDAVTQTDDRGLVLGLITHRVEAEADLQVSGGVLAGRVQMHRIRHDIGTGLEQSATVRIEDVRVTGNLVHGPGDRLISLNRQQVVIQDLGAPDHVVEDVASTHRAGAGSGVNVVHFADFHGGHI